MRGLVGIVGLSLLGCDQYASNLPESAVLLGGAYVQPETLELGRKVYIKNCAACHGIEGDGRGPASPGLKPAPRNLQTGVYRFAAVEPGVDLPRDEELMRILEHGLEGTAMLAYDLTRKERSAVIQYIKTFAPVWFDPDSKIQEAYSPTEDPYEDDVLAGVQRGEQVYHSQAACWACHPSYLSEEEIQGYRAADGLPPTTVRANYRYPTQLDPMPPDYRWDGVKISSSPEGVYRTLVNGLAGSGMPAYGAILEDDDIWAVAHYVSALVKEGKDNNLASSNMPSQPYGEPPEVEQPLADEAGEAAAPPPQALVDYGCLGCHSIDSPMAGAGPSLYKIGSEHTPEEIAYAIREPDAEMAEGFEYATGIMSGTLNANGFYTNVTDAEFEAIVTYLSGLK